MERTLNIRPYIGNKNLMIDGRMIPCPLVTARDYIMARHEYMTDGELNMLMTANAGKYRTLNTIIALKQAIYLLGKTEYSDDGLIEDLTSKMQTMIKEYNSDRPIDTFDEDYYDNYAKHISVVYETLSDIDISDMKMPICVVYEHPLDYPDKYVVRIMNIQAKDVQTTNAIILRDTVKECREEIQNSGFFYCVPPIFENDKCIVETWMRWDE